jgi:hypothetical protein
MHSIIEKQIGKALIQIRKRKMIAFSHTLPKGFFVKIRARVGFQAS